MKFKNIRYDIVSSVSIKLLNYNGNQVVNKLTECIYAIIFYLSQEQWIEINKKRKEIEDFLRSNLEGYIQIVREDLVQDSKFDESYLD